MTQVPMWLYEVMKKEGDLDENNIYHGITLIPEDVEIGDEE